MPHHKSAKKRLRQALKRRERNRAVKSRVKTFIKKYKKMIDAGELEQAKEFIKEVYSVIDKAAKYGVIHKNKAANLKSKVAKYSQKQSV